MAKIGYGGNPSDDEAFQILVAGAADSDGDVRLTAVATLPRFYDSSRRTQMLTLLSNKLEDESPAVRIIAAMALAKFPASAAKLASALDDPEVEVRRSALVSLLAVTGYPLERSRVLELDEEQLGEEIVRFREWWQHSGHKEK